MNTKGYWTLYPAFIEEDGRYGHTMDTISIERSLILIPTRADDELPYVYIGDEQ